MLQARPGEVVFTGEFIEFRVTEDAPTHCAGVPEYLDRYTGALYEELQVPNDARLLSHSLTSIEEVHAAASREVLAFEYEGAVVSSVPVFEHELVHAVQGEVYESQPLLTEGLAELFGGDAMFGFRSETGASVAMLLEHMEAESTVRGGAYGVAGRFVAYLDHRFGRDVLLDLLDITSRSDTSVERFISKVETATQTSWEDVERGFEEDEVCEQQAYWDATPACAAAEPLEACDGDQPRVQEIELACDNAGVLGERVDFTGVEGPEVWTYRTVTFDEPGAYGLYIYPGDEGSGELRGYIDLKRCRGGCGSFLRRFETPTGISVAESFEIEEPGEYLLKIARPLDAPPALRFVVTAPCG